MIKRINKYLILILTILLVVTGCKDNKNISGREFKELFESFNDTLSVVNIDEDNPFIIKKQDDITSLIESEKAFIVFYANPKDDNSRQMIDSIIKEAKTYSIKTIYYIEMNEDSDYQINNKRIESFPSLVAVIKKDLYSSVNNKDELNLVIEPVAKELSTCDIDVGC